MEFTEQDFQGKNLKTDFNGFLLYYADWCGYCKELKPIWNDLAKTQEMFSVAKVNCTEGNKELLKLFEIKGFPTIQVFKNGKYVGDYEGGRSSDEFIAYAKRNFKEKKNVTFADDKKVAPKTNYWMWGLLFLFIISFVIFVYRKKIFG